MPSTESATFKESIAAVRKAINCRRSKHRHLNGINFRRRQQRHLKKISFGAVHNGGKWLHKARVSFPIFCFIPPFRQLLVPSPPSESLAAVPLRHLNHLVFLFSTSTLPSSCCWCRLRRLNHPVFCHLNQVYSDPAI